jgi:hypothetical protein
MKPHTAPLPERLVLPTAPGRPLPASLREDFERFFEADLSAVRLHVGPEAAALGARAFTDGARIFLSPAVGRLESVSARFLLAHELTHVLQQRMGRVPLPEAGEACLVHLPELEAEAETQALRWFLGAPGASLQRRALSARRCSSATGLAVQCRIEFLNNLGDLNETVFQKLRQIYQRLGEQRFSWTQRDVTEALEDLRRSVIDYGQVDLNEEQHLAMLYHHVKQARTARSNIDALIKWSSRESDERLKQLYQSRTWRWVDHLGKHSIPRDSLYKLILIGYGSSAAYYLNSLGPTYDHSESLLIGKADPWDTGSQSGRGQGYINHQSHQISQWGGTVPTFSSDYMDRQEFANQNAAVIERARAHGLEHRNNHIRAIRWIDREQTLFEVELDSGVKVYSEQVIVCMGAGPHIRAEQTSNVKLKSPNLGDRVVDLDTFMRTFPPDAGAQPNVSVVVHGPNAGIDAVERARELDFYVYWFIRNTAPVFLSGNQLQHATKVNNPALHKVELLRVSTVDIRRQSPHKLSVSYATRAPNGRAETVTISADYYVVALGQDCFAPGAVGNVLDVEILAALEPLPDINQIYAPAMKAAKAGTRVAQQVKVETVLGLQTPGSGFNRGLRVVGAAAYALVDLRLDDADVTGRIPGNKLEAVRRLQIPDADGFTIKDKMMLQTVTEVSSVVLPAQLGTVKSSVGAIHSAMPRYVTRGAGFSTDNRTMLMTYVTINYPNLSPSMASWFVDQIIKNRRNEHFPLGYVRMAERVWQAALKIQNDKKG